MAGVSGTSAGAGIHRHVPDGDHHNSRRSTSLREPHDSARAAGESTDLIRHRASRFVLALSRPVRTLLIIFVAQIMMRCPARRTIFGRSSYTMRWKLAVGSRVKRPFAYYFYTHPSRMNKGTVGKSTTLPLFLFAFTLRLQACHWFHCKFHIHARLAIEFGNYIHMSPMTMDNSVENSAEWIREIVFILEMSN